MNTNVNVTPRQKISEALSSKKFLFIVIFLSASLLFALIAALSYQSKIAEIASQLMSYVGSYIPSELKELVNKITSSIDTVGKIIKVIGLIPSISVVVSVIMLYLLGRGKTKSPFGFRLFRIYSAVLAIYNLLLSIIVLVLGVVFAIRNESITIAVIAILIEGGISLVALYYEYLYMMIVGTQNSYYTDKNELKVYPFIIVLLWISGIASFLSFGSFSTWLTSALSGLSKIFIAVMFTSYKKEVGQCEDKQVFFQMLFAKKQKFDASSSVSTTYQHNPTPVKNNVVKKPAIQITRQVTVNQPSVVHIPSNSTPEAIIRRSEILLKCGEVQKAYELIDYALNLDPENAKAYVLLVLIEYGLTKEEDLANLDAPLTDNVNYNFALEFASQEYKAVLEGYNNKIIENIQNQESEDIYLRAKSLEEKLALNEAVELYETIIGYKDCEHRINVCSKKIEEIYNNAIEALKLEQYEKAIELFNFVKYYKDASAQLQKASEMLEVLRLYINAKEYISKKQYVKALKTLEKIKEYKDCEELINDVKEKIITEKSEKKKKQRKVTIKALTICACLAFIICIGIIISTVTKENKYKTAIDYYDKENYEDAIALFEDLGDYKESYEYVNKALKVQLGNLGYYSNGNSFYFGSYPQSLVEDSSINSSLNALVTKPTATSFNGWTSFEYYINGSKSNYMWYIDVDYNNDTYRGVYFTSYRPYNTTSNGTGYQDDNGYYTNTIYWFRYDPIKWLILSEEKGKKLIIADLILDSQDYNPSDSSSQYSHNGGTGYTNNYELSNIRKWLNDNFYNTAFNDSQKEMILTTSVDNSVSSTGYSSNDYACNDTNDKIFLLSYEEVMSLFTSPEKRKAQGSDYAKCQGLYVYNSYSYWWLRSPYNYYSINARDVGYGGSIHSDDYVINTYRGIRPACWIETN